MIRHTGVAPRIRIVSFKKENLFLPLVFTEVVFWGIHMAKPQECIYLVTCHCSA